MRVEISSVFAVLRLSLASELLTWVLSRVENAVHNDPVVVYREQYLKWEVRQWAEPYSPSYQRGAVREPGDQGQRPVELFLRDGRVTARGADRALRLSWTLADLRGADHPVEDDVAQALLYRDRGGFA